MINALKFSKLLEEVGFSRAQAEIQLQVMEEMIADGVATKQDLALLRQDLKIVESSLVQLEYRLIIKLGAFMIIGFTTLATLIKFWLH